MKSIKFYYVFIMLITLSCKNQDSDRQVFESKEYSHDTIDIVDYNGLQPYLETEDDRIHVVNFWAMWCAPCVAELPYLQQVASQNPDIDMLLVSMDFTNDVETSLKPFLNENNIKSRVILMDDPDANYWINQIDPSWSGAIPFTIIFNKNKRLYLEQSFENAEDFQNQINQFYN
ncbi:TlpA family protein disulfide reductase [Nonlabens ulvanivorans]|uniref:TlpA family protein disulfide reductase n=1 Tax=Nonlabens ulvanivorans TaxID=906888 RepID=UPI0037CB5A31